MAKRTVSFFFTPPFLLHEKTSFIWLTLRWIICILKQNLKSIANFQWGNTAMKLYSHIHRLHVCLKYTVHDLYYCLFFLFFFVFGGVFVHKCSTALWVKPRMKWTVERKGEVPWVNLHITPPPPKIKKTPKHLQRTLYHWNSLIQLEMKQIQYPRYNNHIGWCSASVFSIQKQDT